MKRFNRIATLIAIVAMLGFVSADMLSAKGGGGGGGGGGGRSGGSSFSSSRSFSSSSSYSKPSLPSTSSGYSKPATSTWGGRSGDGVVSKPSTSDGYSKPGTAPATTTASGGYTKPGSGPAPTPVKATFSSKSSFDRNSTTQIQKQKSAESLAAYKADQDKFKGPKTDSFDKSKYANNGVYSNAPVYGGYNSKTQIEHRDNYYKKSNYAPPTYVYNTSPSFGAFDTIFLFWMMDNMSHNHDAQMMAHNYRNDPGMQEWRREAEKMAKDNTELKAKLDAMDKKLGEIKDQPVDPKFIPKDIPSEAIVSATALKAKTPVKPDLTFVTGKVDGMYDLFGRVLKSNANVVNVKLKETAGSSENLKLLLAGQADMALVQSDVLASLGQESLTSEQTVVYPEFMQLVVHESSGIKSTSDLTDSNRICFPKGSGSASSWAAICKDEPRFTKLAVDYVDSYAAGLDKVVKDPKSVLFLVAALNSPILKKADKMGKLRLASVYDDNLLKVKDTKGNLVYTYYSIDGDTYPNLQYRWWWFNRSIDTLAVNAVLILRTDWVKKYGQEAFDALTLAVLETRTEITQKKPSSF